MSITRKIEGDFGNVSATKTVVIRIFESNLLVNVFFAGFAQYTIIPARYCYKLKTNLDLNRACLLERKILDVQITGLRFIVIIILVL